MVRDKNLRYKDISVITKNIDTYSSLVRSIFAEYNIPVFIDGRADLYSEYNFEDYLDISNTSYKFTKYLKKYNFDYILMPKKRGITTYLSESNDYNVIYSDKKVVIFKAK